MNGDSIFYGMTTCQSCMEDYFTGKAWLDVDYCIDCYYDLFPVEEEL